MGATVQIPTLFLFTRRSGVLAISFLFYAAMKATDRHKLIDRIKTLEGLTDDERSALLGLLRESKTYGLVWEDKPEEVEERLRNELPVLVEDKDRALTDAGPDAPNQILIEGDNLEALATLAYTHAGKIDVIYIDPPYNTGHKDFAYNDTYVDSEDSFKHSKWLSFMSRRLKIARRLLSDNGVIFISIDDNEAAQIKLLCLEVFGQNSFLQQIIGESNPRGSQSSKYFANTHEYLFVFSKRPCPDISFGFKKGEESLTEYPLEDDKGRYRLLGLRQRGGAWRKEDRPLLHYPIYVNPITKEVSLSRTPNFTEEVIPKRPSGELGRWTWSPQKLVKQRSEIVGELVNEGTPNEKWDIFRKNYLVSESGDVRTTKVKSLWIEKEINYQNGGTELKEIIGDGLFAYPKPLFLLTKVLSCSTSSQSTILDFFAGSGTTLHAVMQLNAEDGGKRQCILCTNNENGICENVTYERNKRVISGYTKPNGEAVEGLYNNNLRYYRTDFVGRSRSIKNMRRLVQLSTDMLCIKENLYAEKKTFAGLPTYKNIYRYFEHGEQKMLVIYDERYVDEIVKMISSVETASKIKVYVFSPSEDPWEASFEPVSDKVELCALPQAIYNTYKRILPKRNVGRLHGASTETHDIVLDEEIGGLFAAEPEGGEA